MNSYIDPMTNLKAYQAWVRVQDKAFNAIKREFGVEFLHGSFAGPRWFEAEQAWRHLQGTEAEGAAHYGAEARLAWLRARGTDEDEIRENYGVEGMNFAARSASEVR